MRAPVETVRPPAGSDGAAGGIRSARFRRPAAGRRSTWSPTNRPAPGPMVPRPYRTFHAATGTTVTVEEGEQ